jgi:hypothetical protein
VPIVYRELFDDDWQVPEDLAIQGECLKTRWSFGRRHDRRETEYSLEHKCAATEIAKVLSVRIARALAFEVNFTSAFTLFQTPVSLPLLRPLELRRAA